MTQQLVAQLVFPPAKVQAILNIATGVIVLKSRSDYYVTPLLKTFRWFSICTMVKAQILKWQGLTKFIPFLYLTSLAPSPITLPPCPL